VAHAAGIVILKQTSRHTQNGSTVVARRPNCDEGLRPTLLARTAVGLAVNNLDVTISRYHGQSPSPAIQYPGLLSHYPFDALKKNWMEKSFESSTDLDHARMQTLVANLSVNQPLPGWNHSIRLKELDRDLPGIRVDPNQGPHSLANALMNGFCKNRVLQDGAGMNPQGVALVQKSIEGRTSLAYRAERRRQEVQANIDLLGKLTQSRIPGLQLAREIIKKKDVSTASHQTKFSIC